MHKELLRAIEYARNGDFSNAWDMLRDFYARTYEDEVNFAYACRRVDELQEREKTPL